MHKQTYEYNCLSHRITEKGMSIRKIDNYDINITMRYFCLDIIFICDRSLSFETHFTITYIYSKLHMLSCDVFDISALCPQMRVSVYSELI